jgi:peptide/nickel transport system substrate-binding protein
MALGCSRRTAARLASASTLALTAAALTACGSGSSSGTSPATGSSGSTSTPIKAAAALPTESVVDTPAATGAVDQMTWALSAGEPLTLDPQKSGDYSPKTVVTNLCDTVMQIQPDGSVQPNIATEAATPNAKTVVLTIRDGITFWDGNPLTAEDVAYSLNRNLDPKVQGSYASDFYAVKSITVTGPSTVTIKLKSPDPLIVDKLITSGAGVSEKAFVEKAGKDYGNASTGVMCSGPFKFDSWTPGKNIVVSANDDYWNADLAPKVQRLQFEFIGDNNTLTSALLSGAVDGAYDVPTGSITSLGKSSTGKLYRGKSSISVLLGPTQPTGPGADPAFRQALNLAIDKPAITRIAAGGAGEPMKSMLSPFVWAGSPAAATYDAGYDALASVDKPDLAAAKAKLAEMKEPVPGTVTLAIIAGNQLMLRSATLVQADAKKIGVNIEIKQLQPTVYTSIYSDAGVREKYDLFASSGAIVEVPSPLAWVPFFVMPPDGAGIFNYAAYSNATVTKSIGAAMAESDPQKQADEYVKAQALFAVDGPIIGLTTIDELLYMNDKISGAPAASTYLDYPWAAKLGGTA